MPNPASRWEGTGFLFRRFDLLPDIEPIPIRDFGRTVARLMIRTGDSPFAVAQRRTVRRFSASAA